MVVGCVQHYSTHFRIKLGKSLEPFFHKVKTAKKGDFSKISDFFEKKGHATFEPLWMPNCMPSFRKILRAVFEKSRSGRTNETDSIGPSVFNRVVKSVKTH